MRVIESKTPILILSYRNCEITCCHLDGYGKNTHALLNRLSKIEAEFSSLPVGKRSRIWYNVDENHLNRSAMNRIAESIGRFQEHIYKIAFIGLNGISKWKFDFYLQKKLRDNKVSKAYFLDAERAKEWLV